MFTDTSSHYGHDAQVVQHLRPEPITEREEKAQTGIDDLDFEIFHHKMDMIALEGKETTMKLGASAGMRWGDVAFGIYTAQGDLAVCATGIYFHAVLSQISIKYIAKHWVNDASVGVAEGDSFFYNDPYYGGVHNADMGLAVPLFADGELIGFIAATVHTGECGGSEPGGMVNRAKSRYDEGAMVPPIKVGENFALKEDLLTMLAGMTRDPRTMILDLKARLAAARIAERRIREIIADKGAAFFVGALRRILTVTAEAARAKIAKLNDGIYRQPRFIDTTGPEDALLKINIALEKRGDRLKLRLNGSSPLLNERPLNSYFQGIIGLAMVYFCGWFFYDLPANNALLEAVEWEFPENSFVNAKGDVPVSYAPAVQTAFCQGVFMLGARMTYSLDPMRAVGSWFTGFAITLISGINQWGDPVADITPEINATGCGGRPDIDGVDVAGAFFATLSDCSDVESIEAERPFLYLFRNFFHNSYGHGKHRGGAGAGFGLMVHRVPAFGVAGVGFGARFPSTLGIFGGRAVPPTFAQTVRGSNAKAMLTTGSAELPRNMGELYDGACRESGERRYRPIAAAPEILSEGDTLYVPVGGGAGYGDALERDPEAVLRDVRDGLTSHWAAVNIYRVALDPETLRLDSSRTVQMREEARVQRKLRAKPYREFAEQWLQLRPKDDILRFYGAFPNPA